MKKTVLSLLALALVSLWSVNVSAGPRELHGMLIGAGSGAIIGHAFGGTPEAVLIGSAIGGAVGVTVAHTDRYGYPIPVPFPVFVPPPFPPHPQVVRGYDRNYDRRHHNYRPRCHVVEKTYYRHGRSHTITERVCNDRDYGYDQGRYYNRHKDYRYDRRGRTDRY